MSRLVTALSLLGIQLVIIIAGVAFNQAWLSGLLCVFGWSPACIFLGMALSGMNFSVSVQPKQAQSAIKRPVAESAQQIQKRVRSVEE
jgi:hypothetical protein